MFSLPRPLAGQPVAFEPLEARTFLDAAVDVNNPLSLTAGQTKAITASLLHAGDSGQTPFDIFYTVTAAPQHGTLLYYNPLGGNNIDDDHDGTVDEFDEEARPVPVGSGFTQHDLDFGYLYYAQDGTIAGADQWSFTVATGGGTAVSGDFAIQIVPPEVVLSNSSLEENLPAKTVVGTLGMTGPGAFTYKLVAGEGSADNRSFSIVGNALKTKASFNYEKQSSYSIRVRATDKNKHTVEQELTISVTDVNETPTLGGRKFSLPENTANGTAVGALTGADPDIGQTLSYSITAGNADGAFAIDSATGQITVANSAALDFEKTRKFTLQVLVTDSGGPNLSAAAAVTVNLTNVNEAPTDILLSASAVAENRPARSTVGTLSSLDPDARDKFTYTLVPGIGGDDNALFTISGGRLKTTASFDYETKNSYTIRVRSTDRAGLWVEKQFTIAISDVIE